MSLKLKRAAGDSSFFNLVWSDDAGAPVDLTLFSGLVLQWERPNQALIELPVVIDDAPNGLGHFEPTPVQMTAGSHFLRVKAILISTAEEMYFPDEAGICLEVSAALQSNP